MKLGIMQPYFLPYLGYWQLMNAVNVYVIYDDVAYINRGWINRNNFLSQGQKKLVTISLSKASIHKNINQIDIADDFLGFKKFIRCNYAKAPFYLACNEIVNEIVSFEKTNLADFLDNSIRVIAHYLGFKTTIIRSSEIKKDESLKGKDKILAICKTLGATEYYNAIGGQELYDKQEFAENGIQLYFVKPRLAPYTQFKNEFVPGLSIMDILMFNSKEHIKEMLNDFELV